MTLGELREIISLVEHLGNDTIIDIDFSNGSCEQISFQKLSIMPNSEEGYYILINLAAKVFLDT